MTAPPGDARPTSGRGVALVTGASAGIGREFAEQLAARGYDLVLVARDAARLGSAAAELRARHGGAVEVLPADLASDTDTDRVVARVAAEPRLSMLVNNAGFGTVGTLVEASAESQEAMVRVHVLASLRLTQAAARVLAGRGAGAIVNVSSVAAWATAAGNVNYCATKAYLTSLSIGAWAELRPRGVQVQALCPGFTHSEFHARMGSDKGEIPGWAWLDARKVVRDSLRQLDRRGGPVCVPALRYKLAVFVLRRLPYSVLAGLSRLRARGMAPA
jgi:short-subunit dehydrogenase